MILLEKKIWEILNSRTTNNVDVFYCSLIAKEVKDIAIEFGVFRIKLDIQRELKRLNGELTENEIIQLQMNDIKQDADDYWNELFDQFIKEKYEKKG
jgi:hypothetical protein